MTRTRHLSFPQFISFIFLFLMTIGFFFHEWFGPDIWYHLSVGQQIFAKGSVQPITDNILVNYSGFYNVYWFFQVIIFKLHQWSSVIGVNLFIFSLWFFTMVFWIKTTKVARAGAIGILTTFLALIIFTHRFEIRPEIFSYLSLSIFLYLIKDFSDPLKLSPKILLSFAAVQILWSNTHTYFFLGPCLVGLHFCCYLLQNRLHLKEEKTKKSIQSYLILLLILFMATIISPLGIGGWKNVFYSWIYYNGSQVQELTPPTGVALMRFKTLWFFWMGFSFLFLSLFYYGYKLRKPLFPFALTVVGLYLSATSFRNVTLLPFFSAPLLRLIFSQKMASRLFIKYRLFEPSIYFMVGLLSIFFFWQNISGNLYRDLGTPSKFGNNLSQRSYPVGLKEYLKDKNFTGKVFDDAKGGGYLEYHFPDWKIFIDSRFFCSQEKLKEYFQALRIPNVFEKLSREYRFDALYLRTAESASLIAYLWKHPEWRLVYSNLHHTFFVHKNKEKLFPQKSLKFYDGEDLREIPHQATLTYWMKIFTLNKEEELIKKIQEEVNYYFSSPSVY